MRLRTVLATLTAGLAAATTCLSAGGPAAANTPSAHACSPTVSIDRFSDALDKTSYDGTFVGNFSALAVDRDGSLAALSDRSSLFSLDARTLAPRGVVALADENGAALDSEGLAIDRDGTRLVASASPRSSPSPTAASSSWNAASRPASATPSASTWPTRATRRTRAGWRT